MSYPAAPETDDNSKLNPLKLWRPDFEFIPDWFVIDFRWEGREMMPEESFIRRKLLTSALPLLRDPVVGFTKISPDRILLSINSPDAMAQLQISKNHIVLDMRIAGDAVAAIRFCENVDGNCCSGINRVRVMPDGDASRYYPLESGYVFGRVLESQESPHQTITLSAHPIYGRVLVLDQEIQIGEQDESLYSGTMVAHAYSNEAKRVLILGGGDCGVLREVLTRPVEHVVMVEYDEEVVHFCKRHFQSIVGNSLEDPRVELRFEDAFFYLKNCTERFDLILSDLPDTPIGNFTLDDQIRLMRSVLAPGGTLGTHSENNYLDGSYEAEPIITAISHQFERVDITSKVIPTYQDQTWLFVRATDPSNP